MATKRWWWCGPGPTTTGRRSGSGRARWAQRVYREYPAFAKALGECDRNYNRQCDTLERLKQQGRVCHQSLRAGDHQPVEKDMEKLGRLYHLGYEDARRRLDALRAYLA